jgi:MarR family transcriptional repressor of emrRAB
MHRSNLTGLVDRLEQRGLVRRRDQHGDRRAWRVVLTPAGRRLLGGILPAYYKAAEAVWGDMPAAQIRSLLENLDHLSRNASRLTATPETAQPLPSETSADTSRSRLPVTT